MDPTTSAALPTNDTPLAAIALQGDAYATVLDRHRLDFCCAGRRTLLQACAAAGLQRNDLLEEMAAEARARSLAPGDGALASIDWRDRPLPDLVRHVVDTHHRFTREALARIKPLMAKVLARHNAAHPELETVARTFHRLADELAPHMLREEQVVFPHVLSLYDDGPPHRRPFGGLANPVRELTVEHETAGSLLDELRILTSSFTAPPQGCGSYRALYAAMDELRRDLMVHVALENQVLFPRALARAEQHAAARQQWDLIRTDW
jgi:regulator of cell morphogenesis and NO signaling